MKWGADYTFRHLTGNMYNLCERGGQIFLCVKVYGRDAIVVDKHRTTLVTKQTTNMDRFDRGIWHTASDGDIPDWWIMKEGPTVTHCDGRMVALLDKVTEHHEQFIGKLITE